ncbi:MAG: hypothetical protein V4857_18880, partial [Pseudomonadota bacterium]
NKDAPLLTQTTDGWAERLPKLEGLNQRKLDHRNFIIGSGVTQKQLRLRGKHNCFRRCAWLWP